MAQHSSIAAFELNDRSMQAPLYANKPGAAISFIENSSSSILDHRRLVTLPFPS
jgi:hypothetical protein